MGANIQFGADIGWSAFKSIFGDFGTNTLGWILIFGGPICIALLRARRVPWGERWAAVRSQYRSEIKDVLAFWVFLSIVVFLYEAAWNIPHRINQNAANVSPLAMRVWPVPDPPLFEMKSRVPTPQVQSLCVENARPYQCKTPAEFGQILLDESAKVEDLVAEAIREINANGLTSEESHLRYLTVQLDACCAKEMSDMREEAYSRLGVSTRTPEEEFAWKRTLDRYGRLPHVFPDAFRDYMQQYFAIWGKELKKHPKQP
jgi:hypothetical protein